MTRKLDTVEIRRICHDEWERIRAIRLEALEKSPGAFFTQLADLERLPDSHWRRLARGGAAGVEQVTILGVEDDRTIGMAVGLKPGNIATDVVSVVSVFVSQPARRCGIGSGLLSGVEAWARDHGASTASLWVVDSNVDATRFYESVGFRSTSERREILEPPSRWETRYFKDLAFATR